MNTRSADLDVVVVGGGPAGSAAAITLAHAGRRVTLVEQARFPRYHIGESLLPHCWHTLDRLGVREQVEQAGFQSKRSVAFVTPQGKLSRPFRFDEHLDHPAARTWQVDRARFDALLLDHAARSGVRVLSQTRATGLVEHGGQVSGIHARGPDGPLTLHAPWTLDASGRDGFVRTLRRWRHPEPALQRLALWTYYEGADLPGALAEATTIVQLPDEGWAWLIPMPGGRLSVGIVAHREAWEGNARDRQAAWDTMIPRNPWLAARLEGAKQVEPIDLTTDYSYRSAHCADNGVVLAGDAFAFLDPVFSSGVFLALRTGEEAARAVHGALNVDRTDAAAMQAYGEWVCEGIEAMRALVFSFYDPEFSMGQLVREHPELRGDVTDVLIGHLFKDHTPLRDALRRLGTVPDPLPYGRARTPEAVS